MFRIAHASCRRILRSAQYQRDVVASHLERRAHTHATMPFACTTSGASSPVRGLRCASSHSPGPFPATHARSRTGRSARVGVVSTRLPAKLIYAASSGTRCTHLHAGRVGRACGAPFPSTLAPESVLSAALSVAQRALYRALSAGEGTRKWRHAKARKEGTLIPLAWSERARDVRRWCRATFIRRRACRHTSAPDVRSEWSLARGWRLGRSSLNGA